MSPETPLYDEDFYRWTQHQAALLRAGKWQELDYANLAEEIEGLGQWDKRDLEQRLEALLIQSADLVGKARRPLWPVGEYHPRPAIRARAAPAG